MKQKHQNRTVLSFCRKAIKSFSVLVGVAIIVTFSFAQSQDRWVSFTNGKVDFSSTAAALNYTAVNLEKNAVNSTFQISLDFPGVNLSFPDDNGLLAGKYATFSFVGKDVDLMSYTVNGTFRPEKLGQPDLPFVRFHVQLPSSVTEDQISVSVIPSLFTPLEGEYTVAPIQQQLYESFYYGIDIDTRIFQQNKEIYLKNANFSHPLEYELGNMHGMKILEIRYSPMQYNPVLNKVFVANKVQILVNYPITAVDESQGNIFEQIVKNSTFDGITGTVRHFEHNATQQQQRAGKVVVVSAQKLLSTQAYADWEAYRKNQGYEIVEKIDAGAVTDITTKLKTMYTASKFDYVIVVGDETVVPCPVSGTNYHYKVWSRLAGTDDLEDVGLGIFLADDEAKLANIVQHQKWQEASGTWNKTQLSTSGSEVSGGTWNRFSTGHYGTIHLDKPDGGLGFKVNRVYQVASIPTKYGGSNIGLPIVPFEAWTLNPTPFYTTGAPATTAIIDFWNKGAINVSHRDHGSVSGTGTPPMSYTLFSTGKITSTCSPYFTSLNCLTGNFIGKHSSNFAYMAQSSKYGTCTNVGATVVTMSGDNDNLHLGIYYAMYPKPGSERVGLNNVGKIWLQGHIKGQSHSRTYFHNYGDVLTNLSFDGTTAVNNDINKVITGSDLRHNGSKIIFQVSNKSDVNIVLYNLQGKLVKTLVNGAMDAGVHSLSLGKINANNQALGSGMYLARMEAGNFVKTINLLIK